MALSGQSESDRALMALRVAVFGMHIEIRRQASVIFGRETAFIEVGIADGAGVESREQTAEVVDLIERNIVEHIHILIGIAAMDIHIRHPLDSGGHTRLELQSLDHIALAENHRGFANLLVRLIEAAYLGAVHRLGVVHRPVGLTPLPRARARATGKERYVSVSFLNFQISSEKIVDSGEDIVGSSLVDAGETILFGRNVRDPDSVGLFDRFDYLSERGVVEPQRRTYRRGRNGGFDGSAIGGGGRSIAIDQKNCRRCQGNDTDTDCGILQTAAKLKPAYRHGGYSQTPPGFCPGKSFRTEMARHETDRFLNSVIFVHNMMSFDSMTEEYEKSPIRIEKNFIKK